MSSYTMQLKTYIRQATQYQEGLSERERIEEGRKKLFDFEYPIFDEAYRNVFETHFIRNFYMREIGFETEGLFKFQLETWLIINMPYFNKLFESELIQYDPLTNSKTDLTYNKTNNQIGNVTGSQDVTGTNTSNQTNDRTKNLNSTNTDNNFERDINADTPDSRLNLTTNDGQGILEYASNIKENSENNQRTTNADETTNDETNSTDTGESHSDTTTNSTIDNVEDFIQSRSGKIGVQTYPEMVQKYRDAFLRVERQIFDEMQELFMLVY